MRESYNVLGCLSAQLRAVKHCTSAEHVLLFFYLVVAGTVTGCPVTLNTFFTAV